MAQGKTKKKTRKNDTRQRAVSPRALLYGLDEDAPKGARVRSVLENHGIRPITIQLSQLNDSVGYLAGVSGCRPATHPYVDEAIDLEFLVLCDVSNKVMDDLLPAMREADAYVGAKCVLTPHNRIWPVRVLMNQVSQEHAAMTS